MGMCTNNYHLRHKVIVYEQECKEIAAKVISYHQSG